MEKLKYDKKSVKKWGGQKRPKCQINDQNRHFAKSEPPGPGVFQSLGVPRDPILRPKSTWGGSDGEFLHDFYVFHFLTFVILSLFMFFSFVTFSLFLIFSILMIFMFWWFLVNFCCWHHFWSFIVSILGAWFMTHFSPRISALPTIPILVVKYWPHFGV